MATRSRMFDGITIEMEERDLQVVERLISALEKELNTTQAALATAQTTATNDMATHSTALATVKTESANKDAEIATLKSQLNDAKISPAALDKMVTDRVATVQRAKSIIGDALIVDGKTDADMRKQVVLAKLGDTAKDWNDDMITASFNTLTVVPDSGGFNGNGLTHVVQVIANNDPGADPRGKAYSDYENELQNRWKTAGHRTQ